MRDVSIGFTDRHAAAMESEIASGDFASVSEVIRAALREVPPRAQPRTRRRSTATSPPDAKLVPAAWRSTAPHRRAVGSVPGSPNDSVASGPTEAAVSDTARRRRALRQGCGAEFARDRAEAFLDGLDGLAPGAAAFGTEHPRNPGFRTFGYGREATLLVGYAEGEMRRFCVHFAGQDWQA